MHTVQVARTFVASVPDAEAHWYDTGRWGDWLTPVIDVLFIRRAMTASLEQTLSRFGASLESDHPPPWPP